jgi:HTH-type transcriptional regulator/antitoxin HigA
MFAMKLKIIKTKEQYNAALEYADKALDKKVAKESDKGIELKKVLLLIKEYEDQHYRIPLPVPEFRADIGHPRNIRG